MPKLLIIRFSSIGDIIQCMSITAGVKAVNPNMEIHWITRKDMAPMLYTDPNIDKLWEFDKKNGLSGLIKLSKTIKQEGFDYVYDAHLNTRSFVVKSMICSFYSRYIAKNNNCIIRKKNRFKRFLFFSLKMKSALQLPFRGMYSFQEPLIKKGLFKEPDAFGEWYFSKEVANKVDSLLQGWSSEKAITIVPSAAWELKRWPVEYWKKLIELLPDFKFIITAGPTDDFTSEIESVAPKRVLNLAGKTNLLESFYLISKANYVVSADTGFLHAADLFGIKGIALMGPTAFGHPTGKHIKVMETDLPCRPCTKEGNAKCKLQEYKKCLMHITPLMVAKHIKA